jgi:hypothetical protein
MESNKYKKSPVLLPMYFKSIGLAVMILAIVSAIIINALSVEMVQSQKEVFRVFTLNAFILGLLFIAWSKDKIEDEMTVIIRLKAMAWTFTSAVLCVIIVPVIDLLLKNPIANISGRQIVMSMLFFYLLIYYFQKRGR